MNPILINVKVLLNLGQYLLHILAYYIQSTQIFFKKIENVTSIHNLG